MLTHRERGVEQKDALLCPRGQVAAGGRCAPKVRGHLLIDVAQARGQLLSFGDRERETHGLAGPVIGGLAQNHNAYICGRGERERIEDVILRGIDGLGLAHGVDVFQETLRLGYYVFGQLLKPFVDMRALGHETPLGRLESKSYDDFVPVWMARSRSLAVQERDVPQWGSGFVDDGME